MRQESDEGIAQPKNKGYSREIKLASKSGELRKQVKQNRSPAQSGMSQWTPHRAGQRIRPRNLLFFKTS
jgi:hypothetical protein